METLRLYEMRWLVPRRPLACEARMARRWPCAVLVPAHVRHDEFDDFDLDMVGGGGGDFSEANPRFTLSSL